MRNKLLGVLNCYWQNGIEEIDQSLCMSCIFVVKVDPIIFLRYLQHLIISSMLQNQLLNQIESFFVINMLPNLDDCPPRMRSKFLFAIVTLHIAFNKLSYESLLNFGFVIQLFFNSNFNFYPFGVALGPDKTCINNLCSIESLYFL